MAFHLALFLLITLFTISSTANAVPLNSILNGGILGGVLTCTNTSIAVAGTYNVIPDAKVDFICGLGSGTSLPAVIQSTRTNTAGIYNFLIASLDALLLDTGKCYLNVTLPPTSCILNIPASVGILRIPVSVLDTIDLLVGRIYVLVPGALTLVNLSI